MEDNKKYIKKIRKDDPLFMGMDMDDNMVAVRIDAPMGEKIDRSVQCIMGAYQTKEMEGYSTAFGIGVASANDYCAMLLSLCKTMFDNVFDVGMIKTFLKLSKEQAMESVMAKASTGTDKLAELLNKLMTDHKEDI